jgi:hypothetical protein
VLGDSHEQDVVEPPSNLIGVARLAFPEQLIEIVFKAVLPPA